MKRVLSCFSRFLRYSSRIYIDIIPRWIRLVDYFRGWGYGQDMITILSLILGTVLLMFVYIIFGFALWFFMAFLFHVIKKILNIVSPH